MGSGSPCASCKLLRRRCTKDCIFAPFFPADDPHKFAIVHKVFGAINVSKMLQYIKSDFFLPNELPAQQQGDAVSSLVYEANDRIRDPVYGCNQVSQLQMQLAVAQGEILCSQMQHCDGNENEENVVPRRRQVLLPAQLVSPYGVDTVCRRREPGTTQRKILGYATGCHLPSPLVPRSAGPCSGFPSIVGSEGVLREGGAGMGEEEDPDWLRAFQPPTTSMVMLSSDSYDSPENSPTRTTPSGEEQKGENKANAFGKDEKPTMESNQDKPAKRSTPKKLVKFPSSSNASKVTGPKAGPDQIDDTLEHREEGVAEVDMQDKLTEHSVSQRLPLIIPDKVHRSKALIECDGDSIDLSGDVGAVGRIVISNSPNGNQDLLLDLKGTIYKSTIVPSRTFCVIESIMNDFIQLEPQSNLFEAETMVEGTLDGFTFDSDEEGDKLPEPHASQNDQNNEDGDQPKAKTKRKAEKPAVCSLLPF
uniref:LOB domain-containing protein n=2 Tax=Oryza nivara TaxID=4536 RepID=A0A0E0IAU5_ORYNI